MAARRMIYGGDGAGAPNPCTAALHPVVSPSTDSLFLSGSSPSFLGSRSMVSFEDANSGKRPERSFFCSFDDDKADEEYDEYFYQPEKKRRLTVDQVQFLEKSFEIENKLEPERKVQLAKDLSLQPRQVAIWFQNRRARWKTKQMEKDYDVLQSSYNSLEADYENLLKEKEKLNAEVLHLSEKLLFQQKQNLDLDQSDTEKPPKSPSQGGTAESTSEAEASKSPFASNKLEEIASVKSDVLDSDSPRYREAGDMSYVDQSDLSQDEEDNMRENNTMAPSLYVFPKTEDDDYSCYYGFPAEDHHIDFWAY